MNVYFDSVHEFKMLLLNVYVYMYTHDICSTKTKEFINFHKHVNVS